jgi:hypothetical protein
LSIIDGLRILGILWILGNILWDILQHGKWSHWGDVSRGHYVLSTLQRATTESKISKAYFRVIFPGVGTYLICSQCLLLVFWHCLKVCWAIARVQYDHSREQSCVLGKWQVTEWKESHTGIRSGIISFMAPALLLIHWVTLGVSGSLSHMLK